MEFFRRAFWERVLIAWIVGESEEGWDGRRRRGLERGLGGIADGHVFRWEDRYWVGFVSRRPVL